MPGAACPFLRSPERLGDWQREARCIGFLDEGYAASQLWKEIWERYDGDRVSRVAQAIVQRLLPLDRE